MKLSLQPSAFPDKETSNEVLPLDNSNFDDESDIFGEDNNYGLDVKEQPRTCIVRLNHPFRNYWDAVIIVALLYTSIVTPFEVAFLTPSLLGPMLGLFIVNRFVDFVFLFDMILTLMTPVLDFETGTFIYSHRLILREYAKFWLWIDLLSLIPFDAIAIAIALNDPTHDVSGLQAIRVLRVLRLIRLIRLVKSSKIIQRRQAEMDFNYSTLTFVKFSVGILILTHWISCLMGLIPSLELGAQPVHDSQGNLLVLNWITGYFEVNLQLLPDSYNVWSVYLAGCYYALMTLSTIGYGDVTPKTDAERGVAIVIMFLGATFYAYAVGSMCSIVVSMDKIRTEFKAESDQFANFLDQQSGFSVDTKQKIKRYLLFSLNKKRSLYHRDLLANLSDSLQNEIAYELSKHWVGRIPFLAKEISATPEENSAFVYALAKRLTPEAFPALETLITKNKPIDKMYLLDRGEVYLHTMPFLNAASTKQQQHESTTPTTSTTEHDKRTLSAGASFGTEICIMHSDFHSSFFATSISEVDVLTLTKTALSEILNDLPLTRMNLDRLSKSALWNQFQTKMKSGGEVSEDDPEEVANVLEATVVNPGDDVRVKKIVGLNKELKQLHRKLEDLTERIVLSKELLEEIQNQPPNTSSSYL